MRARGALLLGAGGARGLDWTAADARDFAPEACNNGIDAADADCASAEGSE